MKSDEAIKTDIYKYLKGSELDTATNGVLTKQKRPRNSKQEDVVISILANENGQVQVATVNVNIYVADITVDGQPDEDSRRIAEICETASNLLNVFRGPDYRATLLSQRVYAIDGADEHMINNKIEYKHLNE